MPSHELDVRVDRTMCAGTANCQFWAAATFDLDDDNKAIALDPPGDTEDDILVAMRGCPTGAISVLRGGVPIE